MFGTVKQREERDWDSFESEAIPHIPDIYRIAYWLVRDRDEAQDLVQETFFQAMRSFHRYEIGTNCRAWLTKIMYNLNGKRIRKLSRFKLYEDVDETISETIAFEPPIETDIKDKEIVLALKRLPDSFRHVVLLADVEEFTYREVSEFLGIPAGTVMSRLHRGRQMLRMELTKKAQEFGIRKAG